MTNTEQSWLSKLLEPLSIFTFLLFLATIFLGIATIWFINATDKGSEEANRTAIANTKEMIEKNTAEADKSLERATEDTVQTIQATARETERSIRAATEARLLPIVVLGTVDDFTDKGKPAVHTIVIRNIGFGPALNTVTGAFGIVTIGHATVQFNHRSAITPGEVQDIDYLRKVGDEPDFTRLTQALGIPPSKGATLVESVEKDVRSAEEAGMKEGVAVCISYANAERETYETWHRLYETPGRELAIDFLCQSKARAACRLDKVQRIQGRLNHNQEPIGAFADACRAN